MDRLLEFKAVVVDEFNSRIALVSKLLAENEATGPAIEFLRTFDYESLPWKQMVMYFIVSIYLWELFLEFRQRSKLKIKHVPLTLKGIVDQSTFEKSNRYNIDKWSYKFMADLYTLAQTLVLIHYDILPLWWAKAGEVVAYFGYSGEILQSVCFLFSQVVATSILNMPLNLYSTFVIEARHGFNKTTLATFITDILKAWLLTLVLGMPFLAGCLAIVQWTGTENFTNYLFLFFSSFQIFMLMIYPTFIAPLFNKFTKLENGSLKTKIDSLASKFSFPLTQIYVVDGSKRSAHSNAYFFGLFNNKRIVLYDTLLEKTSEEEIVAVLGMDYLMIAHELGHWYHSHMVSNIIIAFSHFYVLFSLFQLCINVPTLYTAFGFNTRPVLIGFLLFQVSFG
jgi:STE24 endopeptidase